MFDDCSVESRLKRYDCNRSREFISKGTVTEALLSIMQNTETCLALLSPKWSSLGVGRGVGAEGPAWSLVAGPPSEFGSKPLSVGIHQSDGKGNIVFSAVYEHPRTDEGLKDKLLFVDDIPYSMKLDRPSSRVKSGIYQVTVPSSDLEKFSDEDRTSEDNHCHYYYFYFKRDHSSQVHRLPERVRPHLLTFPPPTFSRFC